MGRRRAALPSRLSHETWSQNKREDIDWDDLNDDAFSGRSLGVLSLQETAIIQRKQYSL